MDNVESALKHIDGIIDQLIANAQKLCAVAEKPNEGELSKLQKQQEELIEKLSQEDEEFKKKYPNHKQDANTPQGRDSWEKLDKFAKLNSKYIETLAKHEGLVMFDRKLTQKNDKKK